MQRVAEKGVRLARSWAWERRQAVEGKRVAEPEGRFRRVWRLRLRPELRPGGGRFGGSGGRGGRCGNCAGRRSCGFGGGRAACRRRGGAGRRTSAGQGGPW